MRSGVQVVLAGGVAALGAAAAVAVASTGSDGVRACAGRQTGEIHATTAGGRCAAGQLAVTISGSAFKSSKGGTLTINGVPFKRGSGKAITINGTGFRTGTLPNSLTINGNSFRTGTLPNTLTINGTTFRTGTLPNSLTINGIPMQAGSGTLTIAGQVFSGGGAAAGAKGETGARGESGAKGDKGDPGPAGAPGTRAAVPIEQPVPGPITAGSAALPILAAPFSSTDGRPHSVLVTGGFNLSCNPCGDKPVGVTYRLRQTGAASAAFIRTVRPLDGGGRGSTDSVALSEVILTPQDCSATCNYELVLGVTGEDFANAGGGTTTPAIQVSGLRLALVDLGPVAP